MPDAGAQIRMAQAGQDKGILLDETGARRVFDASAEQCCEGGGLPCTPCRGVTPPTVQLAVEGIILNASCPAWGYSVTILSGAINGIHLLNQISGCTWLTRIGRVRINFPPPYSPYEGDLVAVVLRINQGGPPDAWDVYVGADSNDYPAYRLPYYTMTPDCSLPTPITRESGITTPCAHSGYEWAIGYGGTTTLSLPHGDMGSGKGADEERTHVALAICDQCELGTTYMGEPACGHETMANGEGAPCNAKLMNLIARGGPCPHPQGDKWAGLKRSS